VEWIETPRREARAGSDCRSRPPCGGVD